MKASALKKYVQQHILTQNQVKSSEAKSKPSRKSSVITKKQYKTIPTSQVSIIHNDRNPSNKLDESRHRMYSVPCSLPKLSEQIIVQQKKALNQIYIRKPKKLRYELMPLKKLQPIRLMKRSSSSNSGVSYLSMSSSRRKPTDQLFSQIQNIRLVERLLLVQPSKQNTKSEHEVFFRRQNKYRKNIQLSKSSPFKSRKIFHEKPWLQ